MDKSVGDVSGDGSARECHDWLRDVQGSYRRDVEDIRLRNMFSRTANRGGGPLHRGELVFSLLSCGAVMVRNGADLLRVDAAASSCSGSDRPGARCGTFFEAGVVRYRACGGWTLLGPCALRLDRDRGT